MAHKFQVGDIVIGNVLARRYGVTGEGKFGIVICTNKSDHDWSVGGLFHKDSLWDARTDEEKDAQWCYGTDDADFIICLLSHIPRDCGYTIKDIAAHSLDITEDMLDDTVFAVRSDCFDVIGTVLQPQCIYGDDVGLSTFIDEF